MKKLVLLSLLAGSMLASCATEAKVAVKPATDPLAGVFEDTDAHDELFADAGALFGGPKRDFTPIGDPIKIGIQSKIHNDGVKDLIDIRFVAAIDVGESTIGAATAKWHRNIYEAGGTETKKTKTEYEVEKSYTSVTNGSGSVLNISDVGADYDAFVVFTVGNIPLESASQYFINAYLEFDADGAEEGVAIYSKVLATTVNQLTQFTFSKDQTGYFGIKKTSSGFTTIVDEKGDNHAVANLGAFGSDERFLFVEVSSHFFQTYGRMQLDRGTQYYYQPGDSRWLAPDARITVTSSKFYLNSSNRVYSDTIASPTILTETFYIADSIGWFDNAKIAVYYHDGSSFKFSGVMTAVEGHPEYRSITIDFKLSEILIFCRINKDADIGWGSGVCWNQTGDLSYDCTGTLITINGWTNGPDGKSGASWGVYPY